MGARGVGLSNLLEFLKKFVNDNSLKSFGFRTTQRRSLFTERNTLYKQVQLPNGR